MKILEGEKFEARHFDFAKTQLDALLEGKGEYQLAKKIFDDIFKGVREEITKCIETLPAFDCSGTKSKSHFYGSFHDVVMTPIIEATENLDNSVYTIAWFFYAEMRLLFLGEKKKTESSPFRDKKYIGVGRRDVGILSQWWNIKKQTLPITTKELEKESAEN